VSPYETYPAAQTISNSETPELYSTHPFRYYTLGTEFSQGVDINPSIYCLESSNRSTCRNADANTGWTQGVSCVFLSFSLFLTQTNKQTYIHHINSPKQVLNAALLGRSKRASSMVLDRASVDPAIGYVFPGFAPHFQDYEPSADHFANMNTALQLMLIQPLDDALENASFILFPAWPCSWDVDFKLHAPRSTIVSGRLVNGTLLDLDVSPSSRRSHAIIKPCQQIVD
jgi:hypothetical protein